MEEKNVIFSILSSIFCLEADQNLGPTDQVLSCFQFMLVKKYVKNILIK